VADKFRILCTSTLRDAVQPSGIDAGRSSFSGSLIGMVDRLVHLGDQIGDGRG